MDCLRCVKAYVKMLEEEARVKEQLRKQLERQRIKVSQNDELGPSDVHTSETCKIVTCKAAQLVGIDDINTQHACGLLVSLRSMQSRSSHLL